MAKIERGVIRKTLRFSFLDGVFASGMIGLTQEYFTPLLLFLGGSAREVGVLVSLPNLVASLVQLKTIDLIRAFTTRRRVITTFVLLQALTLLAIASLAALGTLSVEILIMLAVLFTASGAIALPAWGSLMSDIIPVRKRGAYFGWRNSVLGVIIVCSSLAAGMLLHGMPPDRLAAGFTAVFGLACVFRLLSWAYLRRMYDPPVWHSPARKFALRSFVRTLRSSNFARFVLFVSLLNFSVNVAAPFFTVLMLRDLGFSYFEFSVVLVTATLVMYLMMRRWGRLADSIGNVRVLRFTAPIISIIPLLWLISRHPAFLVGAQVVSGFAWAGFNLCASNFIYDAVPPDRRVRYISYFNVLNGLMLSAGALLGGFLAGIVPPIMGYRILTVLVISSTLRIIVTAAFSFRLREVRSVVSIKSDDLFFGMLGIRPFLGVERRTIHIRNN